MSRRRLIAGGYRGLPGRRPGRLWLLPALLCLAWLPSTAAQALQSVAEARSYLRQLQGVEARFVLRVEDETGQVLENNTGMLHLLRPGRLRWEVATPYPYLLLVDGRKVWSYDQELAQITVRELDDELLRTPAGLLLEGKHLEQYFDVEGERQDANGRYWLRLKSIKESTQVREMEIGFFLGALEQLRLWDAFGQLTRIQFIKLRQDLEPDPSLFQFVPPPGVEVLDETLD